MRYKELTIFYPSPTHFKKGLNYALKLREKGTPIPTVDILNGTIAVNKNACLVTDDLHFKWFQSIEPSLTFISIESYLEYIKKVD